MNKSSIPTVAVQLDLGRQKETLEFIESFIRFIAANGYNTLFLHLETGVRTSNFRFADPNKSYSVDEVRRMVEYAKNHGITAVPVVATLGHAEHFVKHSELVHLSEQREEASNVQRSEFCPSLPETYEFLRTFLREIADIFPDSPIHVGCDEVFRMATCSACRARLAKGETVADIFLGHILKIHSFVTGELGRRILIWDDMADFLPELLERIPKDVGMVFWEYDPIVNSKKTKFGNRLNIDIFRRYKELGFTEYYGAPREVMLSNVTSFTEYARNYPVHGMLMTVWEHADDYMYRFYPQIAFAGRLWSEPDAIDREDAVFAEMVRNLFGIDDSAFTAAIKMASTLSFIPEPLRNGKDFKNGIRKYPTETSPKTLASLELSEAVLAAYSSKVTTPDGKLVLRDVLAFVRQRIENLRIALWMDSSVRACIDGRPLPEGGALRKIVDGEQRELLANWNSIRPGLDSSHLEKSQKERLAAFDRFADFIPTAKAFLEVRLFLPDVWGRQQLKFELKRPNGEYETVLSGTFKPADDETSFYYTLYAPVSDPEATELKITSKGINGVGVSFVRILRRGKKPLVPSAITGSLNQVADPLNLLIDDTTWTMFGNRDGMRLFFDRAAGETLHELTLKLS